ncbi:hypothetical protein [Endozoicomonas arenosclerae]|uniref:hypothetical protein n=1 Tax=Endozoicomonas arenosclerae TaxID=1633495 RepID=UPI0012946D05|nr:hypothetical protein [Endozoicomonas arenosclerae]
MQTLLNFMSLSVFLCFYSLSVQCKLVEPIPVEMQLNPESMGLLDAGFPSDHLRKENEIHWQSWFYPGFAWPLNQLESRYFHAANTYGGGFSPATTLFLRFNQPAISNDLICMPPDCSKSKTIELINLTEGSDDYGQSRSVTATLSKVGFDEFESVLQVRPEGVLLKEKQTYALLVYEDFLKTPFQLQPSDVLKQLLSAQEPEVESDLHRSYQPLRQYLKKNPAHTKAVAAALVWTTGEPTKSLRDQVAHVINTSEKYRDYLIEGVDGELSTEEVCIIKGTWQAPLFLDKGPRLYAEGGLNLDPNGLVDAMEIRSIDFYLSIPQKAEMPTQGFPLLIYNQGTAGSATQFRTRGQVLEKGKTDYLTHPRLGNVAETAAEQGFAVAAMATYMGTEYCLKDAPYPVTAKTCPFVAYNPATPITVVASFYQMVLERILFRRMVQSITLESHQLCSEVASTQASFDPDLHVMMGQSLGAMVVGAAAATEEKPYQGIILSGAGNYGLGLALEFSKRNLGQLQENFLFLAQAGEITGNPFHPVWAMAEHGLSTANVALHLNRWIHSRELNTHVLVIEGTFDSMVSPTMQKALLKGLEIDMAGTEPADLPDSQRLVPEIETYGRQHKKCVSQNRKNVFTGKSFTHGVIQYPKDGILSGHHVAFQLPSARAQYGHFLKALKEGRAPAVGAEGCQSVSTNCSCNE